MEKQMFVLGDLMDKEWDTGWHIVTLTDRLTREKKRKAKWLAGALGRKWELLPSAEVGRKKMSLESDIVVARWGGARAKTLGKERRKYLGQEEKEPYFQARLQNKINAVNPRIKKKKGERKMLSKGKSSKDK